ncbi:hypothetical protein [Endozoicomonas sp. ONNA2]|uniref:hypothetical protein n=1 Tax=Endozoicomonas sp. ONNA2 TaxID=2828741 RepID=UPI002147D638|nr:hypothetical protein [Endozoicomonas sp. ONNA2]
MRSSYEARVVITFLTLAIRVLQQVWWLSENSARSEDCEKLPPTHACLVTAKRLLMPFVDAIKKTTETGDMMHPGPALQ